MIAEEKNRKAFFSEYQQPRHRLIEYLLFIRITRLE